MFERSSPCDAFQVIRDTPYGILFSRGAQKENISLNMTINENMCTVIYTVADVCNQKSKE